MGHHAVGWDDEFRWDILQQDGNNIHEIMRQDKDKYHDDKILLACNGMLILDGKSCDGMIIFSMTYYNRIERDPKMVI